MVRIESYEIMGLIHAIHSIVPIYYYTFYDTNIQGENNHHSEKTNCIEEMDRKDELSDSNENIVIITNTTLSIMRLYGKYLHMMHLLKSIAYDVAVCMCQLFEYYFYTIYVFFISDNVRTSRLYCLEIFSRLMFGSAYLLNVFGFSERYDNRVSY